MKRGVNFLDQYQEMRSLIENQFMDLDDVTDQDWVIVQKMMVEHQRIKKIKQEALEKFNSMKKDSGGLNNKLNNLSRR